MKDPWSKFFWSDWEADQGLRLCSLAAQGLWMRMLCVCARHEPKGYLAINGNPLVVEDIARLAGVAETEAGILMEELDRNGVFSRNRSGCIYSRRMVRDEKRSKEGRKWKKQGLAQVTETAGEKSGPSRVPARGPSPHIPEARSQKDNIGAPAAGSAPKSAKAKGHSLPTTGSLAKSISRRRQGSDGMHRGCSVRPRPCATGRWRMLTSRTPGSPIGTGHS